MSIAWLYLSVSCGLIPMSQKIIAGLEEYIVLFAPSEVAEEEVCSEDFAGAVFTADRKRT
jgi:hypothetical protein